jgi:hypothetical protein
MAPANIHIIHIRCLFEFDDYHEDNNKWEHKLFISTDLNKIKKDAKEFYKEYLESWSNLDDPLVKEYYEEDSMTLEADDILSVSSIGNNFDYEG